MLFFLNVYSTPKVYHCTREHEYKTSSSSSFGCHNCLLNEDQRIKLGGLGSWQRLGQAKQFTEFVVSQNAGNQPQQVMLR